MDSITIRSLLGTLQSDPDSTDAWQRLKEAAGASEGDLSRTEFMRLIDAARVRHSERGEWEAFAGLLAIQADAAKGLAHEADLVLELARVLTDQLFNDEQATTVFQRFLELRPNDATALSALEDAAAKRQRWLELVQSYLSEAEQASDDLYASSMFMRASEMEFRFAGEAGDLDAAAERLERAVRLDSSNERAGHLLERLYRKQSKWEEVARVLERMADRGQTQQSRASSGIRLARLYAKWLEDKERAAQAYERVLRSDSNNSEAMEFLSEFYSGESRWDDLVRLYENELKHKEASSGERLGDCLQIAVIHWRKRSSLEDAEPWFERVRKLEPAHAGALEFYRVYCDAKGDDGKLLEILQNAQRAIPDQAKRAVLAKEIAKLAEGQENAQKAIEQYRNILRQSPDDDDARSSLKRLYRQTQGYNALVELLRQELERVPNEEQGARLLILREVASVYREHIRSDTALVSILNQIVQLDEKLDQNDVVEVRELVQLYEKLARWRDLLTTQLLLAEISPDLEEKKNLYRVAARRWLEQFSNAQQATDAYAALLKLAPSDVEARERLEELYRKRRAWTELYALYAGEVDDAKGERKLSILQEMARLAAERLQRPSDAILLYTQILDADPARLAVLDALERIAEKARDLESWADAINRRVLVSADLEEKLNQLQKLGGVYAEQLKDEARALEVWRRILELSPGQARALRVLRDAYVQNGDYSALEALYASQNDWEGLAEVLSNAADRAKEDAAKIELSYRAAAVYAEKLGQGDRAFRSYERILSVSPKDLRAIEALIPLYEAEEKWVRLPALYEVLIELAPSRAAQVEIYQKLIEVASKRLSNKQATLEYAERAYELLPNDLSRLLGFEVASRTAGNFQPLVLSLEAMLARVAEPVEAVEREPQKKRGRKKKKTEQLAESEDGALTEEMRRTLEKKLAELYAQELGRTDDAVQAYKNLVEANPRDASTVATFEALLKKEQRWDDLRWLLAIGVEHASDEERVGLLVSWAELEEQGLSEPGRAIERYRRVLQIEPENLGALERLSALLLGAAEHAAAASVLEVLAQLLSGDARAGRLIALGRLYLASLNQPELALERASEGLESPVWRTEAISVLEGLLAVPSVQAAAAKVLAAEYREVGQGQDEVRVLTLLLAETPDLEDNLQLLLRIAEVYEKGLSSTGRALDTMLRAVRKFPTKLELWDRAEDLARLASKPSELAEVFREVLSGELSTELVAELCGRAARLHEDRLGDPIGATPYLERVLALNPGDEAAFQRLKDILTAAERWRELESFYDKASEGTEDIVRRVDMLVEVALICEEIIENPERAVLYYERILANQPAHPLANEALLRLYAKLGRQRSLSELLEKRLATVDGEELISTKNQLARLKLELLEPEQAIGHVEDVLALEPQDYVARELAERMLDIGDLRTRAARQLEAVYEARREMRLLDKMWVIRLVDLRKQEARLSDKEPILAERRELLQKMAELRDEKLHDDEAALESLAELVPLVPFDEGSRARLLEVGQRMAAHERVAAVLLEAAKHVEVSSVRGEILLQAAGLYEGPLNDEARAEATYREVLGLDEFDRELVLAAARALEPIYERALSHTRLAEIYGAIIRHETEPTARVTTFGKLGNLASTALNDPPAAVSAWEARLEVLPDDEEALRALDALFVQIENWPKLVEVLEKRFQLAPAVPDQLGFLLRVAEVQRDKLRAVSDAIDSYRRLVELFGATQGSLSALEQLFEESERWGELAEALEQHLDLTEEKAVRLALLARLGSVKHEQLHDVEGALEAYRRALSIDAEDVHTEAALARFLDADDPVTRREAAETLHPIYEAAAQHEKLLRVIEIEVETNEDPFVKLERLGQALAIAEGALKDARRALGYVKGAVRLATGSAELPTWLVHLERLAESLASHTDQVALLREIAPEVLDGDVQLEIYHKIAAVARERLKEPLLAQEYYEKALELKPDDRASLVALESLFEELGQSDKLLQVIERRIDAADSEAEQKQFLYRKARLLATALKDQEGAVEAYQRILDLALEVEALHALEKLYAEMERWTDLVELYQRQIDAKIESAPNLRVKIAAVLGERQGDVARALEELEAALAENAQHEGTLAALEHWLTQAESSSERARAAEILEPVYLRRAAYDDLMRALTTRLDHATDPDERRTLLTRLAKLYEEQKEDYAQALETTAQMLPDALDDESVVSELERLAKVAGGQARLAEIYAVELGKLSQDDTATAKLARRTGELFAHLGKTERALQFYQRALDFEPESKELFGNVDGLLERTQQHAARVELYRMALEHRYETSERLAALHTIAALQRGALGEPEQAIATYQEALTIDDTDSVSLAALADLYRAGMRFQDLAALFELQAESGLGAEAVTVRLALARIYRKELSDAGRAVDQLETVLELDASNAEALVELEELRSEPEQKLRVVEILRPLYEAKDDWRRLIQLNEDRFQISTDVLDQVNILRETAELWRERGKDLDKARRALEEAVKLDPEDSLVREEYERVVRTAGAFDALAIFYEELLQGQPELRDKAPLLATLARIHDKERDDARAALHAYSRLHLLEPLEREPLQRMQELAVLLGDWPRLVEVLQSKAQLAPDDEERAASFRYVGEVRRDMLSDRTGAAHAYEEALDLEPDHTFTLDCLIELYETAGNAVRLVELYEQRLQLTDEDDAELRYQLRMSAARAFEKDLGENGRAIDLLERALEERPRDADALSEVQRLYELEQRFGDLLHSLKGEVDAATDRVQKLLLRRRIAKLLTVELQNFDEALDEYAGILGEDASDSEAQLAVASIAANNDLQRQRAAEILLPVLRNGENYQQLVSMLELSLTVATEASERVDILREIARVEEQSLSRKPEAFAALMRALSEAPALAELHSEVERLCATKADYNAYAERLEERALATFDPELACDLFSRLGRIAEEHLKDDVRATAAYVHAIEQAGDQPELLGALDRLYTRLGRAEELADILERRALAESGPEAQAEIYHRLGKLQIDEFKSFDRGLSSLRMALERAPNHGGAVSVLESLTLDRDLFDEVAELLEVGYRSAGQTDRLAGLYEKRVGFAQQPEERVEMRRDLARVLEEDCRDPRAAQRVLQSGLKDAPSEPLLLEEVERLAALTADWQSAAEAFRDAIASSKSLGSQRTAELLEKLAGWYEHHLNDRPAAEAVLFQALDEEPTREELLLSVERLQREPGRERDLIATLERRAKLSLDADREQILREAVGLAGGLADSALAERLLRELLVTEPDSTWALAELTGIAVTSGNFKEALELLVRRSELGAEGESVLDLRRQAARIADAQLGDGALATGLYEQLLENEPMDAESVAMLRKLYTAGGAPQKLADLLERLIDQADSPSVRRQLRMDLAKLQAEELAAPEQAIDLLHAILDSEPGDSDAVVFLSELLEKSGKAEDLAELLRAQIELAVRRGDTENELRFQVRLAEICELRLADRPSAIQVYEQIAARDPRNVGVLSALVRLCRQEGNLAQSAEFLEKLLDISEGAQARQLAEELAALRLSFGEERAAAAALERALGFDDKNAKIIEQLTGLYETLGEFSKQAALFVAQAEHEPSVDAAILLLRKAAAVESERCKNLEAAAALLKKASDKKPQDRELLLELCDAYSAAGQAKQAILALEQVVASYAGKRAKELAEVHRRLANAYRTEGDIARTLEELDKAFRIEPGNISVLKQLGLVALEASDLKKAQQMFRALLLQKFDAKSPISKAEVFMYLGEIHEKMGETDKALQMFERAVQTDPTLSQATQMLAALRGK